MEAGEGFRGDLKLPEVYYRFSKIVLFFKRVFSGGLMDKDLKKIASRIAKCLAPSASDHAGEAAAAKRQAEALMKKYNLCTDDVLGAAVEEFDGKNSWRGNPPLKILETERQRSEDF